MPTVGSIKVVPFEASFPSGLAALQTPFFLPGAGAEVARMAGRRREMRRATIILFIRVE